jgi:type VI secretion system protein ImpM
MRLIPGCYGKLPIHGDFIRHHVPGPEMEVFDEWLQAGIVVSRQSLGGAWDGLFDSSSPRRFLYHVSSAGGLAGVIAPSRDKPGRRFPFMVFTPVDLRSLAGEESLLPLVLENFFDRAEEVACSGWQGTDLKSFLSRIEALPAQADWEAGRKAALDFEAEETTRELWERLFGSSEDPRKYLLLRNLVETLQTPSVPRYVLRFPKIAGERDVAFWLRLARRLGRRPGLPTLTFWSRARDGAKGELAVMYDLLKANYFMPLWWPERKGNLLFALDDPGDIPEVSLRAARERFAALLDDPGMRLSGLLNRLGT